MAYLVDVLIFKNVIGMDKLFTYKGTGNEKIGSYVIVDFNNRLEIGLVLKTHRGKLNTKIKTVLKEILEIPRLSQTYIELGIWMKNFYVLTYAKAFSTISDLSKISNLRYHYLNISGNNNFIEYLKSKNLKAGRTRKDSKTMNSAILNGHVRETALYDIIEARKNRSFRMKLGLSEGLDMLRINASRQRLLVEAINREFEKQVFTDADLKKLDEYDGGVFRELLGKGIFEVVESSLGDKTYESHIKLTKKQAFISSEIYRSKDRLFLLHGVTGSGKTEVYFDLIEKYINEGKKVKFLVPEIGLTPQMQRRTIERFGDQVSIIHSKINKRDRITALEKIKSGESSILLGTRSAIFVDMDDLGLIIIDEEHDDSYKLNDYNKYDTREVARFLVENTSGAKLVLGSATPSIESYYKAKHQIYKLHQLLERPKSIPLPKVFVTDMREELKMGNKTAFSSRLLSEIKSSLMKGKQVLIFLNRRGYAPFISCRECGYTVKCDSCDISMVYHKNLNFLTCHYCGSTKAYPKICPSCGSKNIRQFGMGTEQLEEITKGLFPDFRVLRIDSDTTNKPVDYESNVEKILNKEVDIIIGTQMTSKGFDFPDLDLVGVISADMSLMMPEYDSAEKTFQLLTQVAGRPGRSSDPGRVVFQTYNPDHFSIKRAMEHDYDSFYDQEIEIRKKFLYPPFIRHYKLTIIHNNRDFALEKSREIYDHILSRIQSEKLLDYVKFISNPSFFYERKIRNRYYVEIVFRSTIKHEMEIKKIIGDIVINNSDGLDLRGLHMDLISR